MAREDDVKRAIAIINTALKHSMFPAGAMPEDDTVKLMEAEKLVQLCRQAHQVATALGKGRVRDYDAAMDVLFAAEVLVGANGDGTAQSAQPDQPAQEVRPSSTLSSQLQPSEPPSASSQQAATSSGSMTFGHSVTPVPASSVSQPSSPSSQFQPPAEPVESKPVDANGVLEEPAVNELWSATGGGRWLVQKDLGHSIEVVSEATGETTTVPKGFLKERITGGHIKVWVADGWDDESSRGFNTLYYSHPGCTSWMVPLDDIILPAVGEVVECSNCTLQLPISSVDAKDYVHTPDGPGDFDTSGQAETQAQASAQAPENYVTLTVFPETGKKVFEHPGCWTWESPLMLDGSPLPIAGTVKGGCENCKRVLPLEVVIDNGYDPATWTPPQQSLQPQTQQEVQPSTLSSLPSQPEVSRLVQRSPGFQATPMTDTQTPQGLISSPVSSSDQQSVPSPSASTPSPVEQQGVDQASTSTFSGTGAPVDDDEGDTDYARILDKAESDWTPDGMPAPQELQDPPPAMPEDLTQNPEMNRELHSKFNALAARARYLAKIDERVARDCGRIARLKMRPIMAKAKKELGASSTLTERREWAEEIAGDDVKIWLERQQRHLDRAEAYGEFFSIYNANVAVLSRDLTWAQNEERGA